MKHVSHPPIEATDSVIPTEPNTTQGIVPPPTLPPAPAYFVDPMFSSDVYEDTPTMYPSNVPPAVYPDAVDDPIQQQQQQYE